MTGYLRVLLSICIALSASGSQAKEYLCSVERTCSEEIQCYRPEYVFDMLILEQGEQWIMSGIPDDGTKEIFRRVEGTNEDSAALFLKNAKVDIYSEQRVSLITILPDMRFLYTVHISTEFDAGGTSYGTCEVTLE